MSSSDKTNGPVSISGWEKLLVTGTLILWTLWVVGQLFRDSIWLTGVFFWIPSPILFVLASACGYRAWRKHRKRLARYLFVCALTSGLFVACVENRLIGRQDVSSGDSLRLIHWNVFHGHCGWDGLVNEIRQCAPDICVLSEVPNAANIQSLATLIGQDYVGIDFGDLAVVARGTVANGEWLEREDGVKAYGFVWHSPQGMCRVIVVDLDSDLLVGRHQRLLKIRKLMVDWNADIVVGDFNAPRRSCALSPLPTGFVHAYDAAGSGWSYTWPLPCPVYAIDQCILGSGIHPVTYGIESSWRSDHRRQRLDFSIDHLRSSSSNTR